MPPDRPLPFPVCGWKALTSLDCPGCGLMRAVCHALHDDLAGSIDLHVAGPAVALALIVGALWLLAEVAATASTQSICRCSRLPVRGCLICGAYGAAHSTLLPTCSTEPQSDCRRIVTVLSSDPCPQAGR